jgi:hypothetical protein
VSSLFEMKEEIFNIGVRLAIRSDENAPTQR